MQWVGYAELASAVSNAGGLGIVRSFDNITPIANVSSLRPSPNQPPKTCARRSADVAP